jgi:predicted O-methyltransferase YrrM
LLSKVKEVSLKDNIPIVREQTIEYICTYIKQNNYQSLLEIGSAYGYSALYLATHTNVKTITSIEKNVENYQKCMQLVNDKKINFINADAFTLPITQKFDVIFIDGPKSHQDKLVNKFLPLLNNNGCIFIDNMFLNKFSQKNDLSKNKKRLVDRVNEFRD